MRGIFEMKKVKYVITAMIILLTARFIFQGKLLATGEAFRNLIAVAKGYNRVFLGWRFFSSDRPFIGFRIYRATQPGGPYDCLNCGNEIYDSTNYTDEVPEAGIYYYVVRTFDGSNEGPNSNEANVEAQDGYVGEPAGFQWLNIKVSDNMSDDPDGSGPAVGDLDGDGLLEYIAKDNNNVGSENPTNTVWLQAYKSDSDGSYLWSFDTGYYYRTWNIHGQDYYEKVSVPYTVWDLDNDGKAEVIVRTDNGPDDDPDVHLTYLTIIEGDYSDPENPILTTGRAEIPLPTDIALDMERMTSEWRVNLPHYVSIGYLDGPDGPPYILVQVAVHDGETISAYSVERNEDDILVPVEAWTFESTTGYFEEGGYWYRDGTGTGGSGTHGIIVYNMDKDAADEVFDGCTLLDSDGTVLWTVKRNNGERLYHPDVVIPGDIYPGHPGPEVWFVNEGRPQGAYLTDASGDVLWEDTAGWGHGHDGWVANLTNDLPGYELYGWNTARPGEGDEMYFTKIFASEGDLDGDIAPNPIYEDNKAYSEDISQNTYHSLIEWDGDRETELFYFTPNEKRIINARFNGYELVFDDGPYLNITPGYYGLRADLVGDYREEFLFIGGSILHIQLYTNTEPISTRKVTRWENLEYRKTAARITGSAWKYFGPIDFDDYLPHQDYQPSVE